MTVEESYVEVLIIGAGPAGLMASNALAQCGVNVRVIDQRPDKVAAGHADGIQPRTIEVFRSYGLEERLLKEGNQMHIAAFYNPTPDGTGIELTDRVPDVTATSARYPFEVTLHQGAIESIFLESMQSFGLRVDRPLIPITLELSEDESLLNNPEAYPVRVVLKHLDEAAQGSTEIVHAKFVIGADGAHSWVRKSLNIVMNGEQTDYLWGVVDLVPDTDFPDIRNKSAIHSNKGSCMVIPREGDKVRIYIQLEDKSAHATMNGRVDKNNYQPHQLLEKGREAFYPFYINTPDKFDWWTIYVIGQRVASQFSVRERVFIVGDACHTHSPKAGQGMNASMNDSHNLAWKLVHVLKGWADISLLKTYEFERKKYAQDLIDFDRQFAKLFSGKPQTKERDDGVSHEEFLKAFQTFGGFTSGIGIRYDPSSITNAMHQSVAKNLIVGQRILPQIFLRAADSRPVEIQDLLPSNAHFKLLVFVGDSSDPAQLEKVRVVAKDLESALGEVVGRGGGISTFCDVLTISSAKKANVRYNDVPRSLWSHWSRVLIDDVDVRGTQGGDGYKNYGIENDGAIVVIRPDGYIGMISPLNGVKDIVMYFSGFVKL